MKKRYEYNNNELGWRLAQAQKMTHGGRVVLTTTQHNDQIRVFWYSYEHTMTEITSDSPSKIVMVDSLEYPFKS